MRKPALSSGSQTEKNFSTISDTKSSLIRAFVAVAVPDPVAEELEHFLAALRPMARIRWVTRAQFHITLRFLGEQTREAIERVKWALAPVRFQPFDVEFSYAGAFPGREHPRVLWLGSEKGKEALIDLAQSVNDALCAADFPKEERLFKPHLTLARGEGATLNPDLWKALENAPRFSWRCDRFALMQSQLTPRGAIYSEISLS